MQTRTSLPTTAGALFHGHRCEPGGIGLCGARNVRLLERHRIGEDDAGVVDDEVHGGSVYDLARNPLVGSSISSPFRMCATPYRRGKLSSSLIA